MFGRIGQEFQCLEGYRKNYNVWKDRARIPTFKATRQQFQCFEGSGQNYGV